MTTLQGIINKGIVNAELQFEKMGYVSTNVSNFSTSGYKAVRFEQMLNESGYLSGVERTDFSQGAIQRTERELDVAIDGAGFIPITSPNGDVAYTRTGSFTVNKDGYLVTTEGYLVGDGIKLPVNYDNVLIKPNGEVIIFADDSNVRESLGVIPLINVQNPEGLKKADNGMYYLTAQSGEPVLLKEHNRFKQASLEHTNIDMLTEINSVLRLNASMLASFKVMQTINDMYTKTLQLNQ